MIKVAIHESRNAALRKAFWVLTSLIRSYQGNTYHDHAQCPRTDRAGQCDAMVLGSLIREAGDRALWPIPQPPYTSHNVEDVLESISSIKCTTLCQLLRRRRGATQQPHDHGIGEHLETHMQEIRRSIVGLELEKFKPNRR
jgi:hypothetical protein